jgi:hypothetical protein
VRRRGSLKLGLNTGSSGGGGALSARPLRWGSTACLVEASSYLLMKGRLET